MSETLTETTEGTVELKIPAPNMQIAVFDISGTAPYVQERFSEKARKQMLETQLKGSQSNKERTKKPRQIKEDYEQAFHRGPNDEHGIPATAFRAGMVSACRTVNFKMTIGKLSIFVLPDFFDPRDGTPLVALEGEPVQTILPVRNASGVADLRVRPMWHKWKAKVRIQYDADQFSHQDIANLLLRQGGQVGVGAGRPDSKKSTGMGWGTFEVLGQNGKG